MVSAGLPQGQTVIEDSFLPAQILNSQSLGADSTPGHKVLVIWLNKEDEEATWITCADFQGQFLDSNLVDKVCQKRDGIDSNQQHGEVAKKPLLV